MWSVARQSYTEELMSQWYHIGNYQSDIFLPIWFITNSYDPLCWNKMENGHQMATVDLFCHNFWCSHLGRFSSKYGNAQEPHQLLSVRMFSMRTWSFSFLTKYPSQANSTGCVTKASGKRWVGQRPLKNHTYKRGTENQKLRTHAASL